MNFKFVISLKIVLVSISGMVFAQALQAHDQPWHLGSNDLRLGGVAAAINTAMVRPGKKM